MTIRHATDDDRGELRRLWELWQSETVDLPPWADSSWETNEPELDRALDANALFVAEQDGELVGFVSAWPDGRVGRIGDLYVAAGARRGGTGKALVETVIENLRARGATHLLLNANLAALTFYERLGFREESRNLVLALAARAAGGGPSFGSSHVQTDDQAAVERAVRQFVPRLPGRSQGSLVSPARNGWVSVYDEACDREPADLARLARELAERLGAVVLRIGVEAGAVVRYALHEGGRLVDEYLSVPEHFGPLPPGDVIALQANPTVVARLTGASPARIRAVARTAAFAAELPPATELVEAIGAAMGIEGVGHGYGDAPELPGGVRVDGNVSS